jgi:hypothetical protein
MKKFNFVYHNFGGYAFGVDLNCPVEFTIARCVVDADNENAAKILALNLMVANGHMTASTAEKYLK